MKFEINLKNSVTTMDQSLTDTERLDWLAKSSVSVRNMPDGQEWVFFIRREKNYNKIINGAPFREAIDAYLKLEKE